MRTLIKYGAVILLFLLLIKYTQKYFDFIASKSNIIIIPLLVGLLVVSFMLVYVYESKNKIDHRTTNLILSILVFLFGVNIYLNNVQSRK